MSNDDRAAGGSDPDRRPLEMQRLDRLRSTMRRLGVDWLLTADPINIAYATGLRNMTVFSMMGASRFLLVSADGPTIAWEYAGAEHLAADCDTIDEVRTAPGVTAISGPAYERAAAAFADELSSICGASPTARVGLGVERLDHPVTDPLRAAGFELMSATQVFVESRVIKLADEIGAMQHAMARVVPAVDVMVGALRVGASENEVWSVFHQHLIANDGEYVSTRLAQAGERTFPYYQEAGPNAIRDGDLFCIDTDAIGVGGYAVDFSRTFHVGSVDPTPTQCSLHALALDQLQHNAALLAPGRAFAEFADRAWSVPERHAPFGYSCLAHGLGMSGEYPYVPATRPADAYSLDGAFEPGMVICVESYIGDEAAGQGVKLEDQFLITEHGADAMSTMAFSGRLS